MKLNKGTDKDQIQYKIENFSELTICDEDIHDQKGKNNKDDYNNNNHNNYDRNASEIYNSTSL